MMLNNLKKTLYFKKMTILLKKGIQDGSIVPFDDDFYEKMSHTYINCIPVSIQIKYLKPIIPPGRCYERSLYMFFCFDNALLVRGDNKDLELQYGKENAGHGWIEINDYVYDPTLLLRFDKNLYYDIYKPTNLYKCSKDDYIRENKDFYEEIKIETLQDFKPGGRKRFDMDVVIPLLVGIAINSNNSDFKEDVYCYLTSIGYDEESISKEMNIESLKKNKK